jgi:hypothetical protein
MASVRNGMPAGLLAGVRWCRSGRSGPTGNCVEFAELAAGEQVGVRNSRHPDGPALVFERSEVAAFLRDVRSGELDQLLE